MITRFLLFQLMWMQHRTANVRRFINEGQLPPAGAVRIEEMINYFNYNYPQPQNDDPFSINTEISNCPWNANINLF